MHEAHLSVLEKKKAYLTEEEVDDTARARHTRGERRRGEVASVQMCGEGGEIRRTFGFRA